MREAKAGKAARQEAVRQRDADRLEASLGGLPPPLERPWLVVMTGLPGSGKSHFARLLAQRLPAAVLNSDALRTVLFARPQHSEREHARLFPAIHILIDRLLARGVPVIVDATNLKEAHRRPYYTIAERHGAKALLVRTRAPVGVIRERLRNRPRGGDPLDLSAATVEVFEKMRGDVEPIRRRHVSVDTSKDLRPALDKVVALLQS